MDKDIAIKVEHLSKTFKIPHEKVSSVRGAFVGMFKGKRTYEEFKALDDVSFEVKKGEFFGIIGRNGSGKSTLLKILAGIYQPDKGKTHIDGMISPFLELGIGFNPELSGRDNVYLNATVLGMTKKQIDEKFDDIVRFSELERFIDQKLKNYSSGMQVRLAFSVSIHANRDILLMDEVLAVGDSNFQAKCLEEFVKYKGMGKTVVLVTHDMTTAQRYCDRLMLLRNGKIQIIGDTETVGNTYIHSNIFDEEERIKRERNKHVMESFSNNENIEIKNVIFFDQDGKEKNVFETGDDIVVRVTFNKGEGIKLANFGIAIYSQDEQYIFGFNTLATKEFNGKKQLGQGFFEFRFFKVPLRIGAYYIKAGIWGGSENVLYDFLDRSSVFKVFTSDQEQGMIHVDYELS